MVKLVLSKYLTIVPYRDYFLIVQGYSGAIVLIKKKIWNEVVANNYISDGRSGLDKIKITLLSKQILIPIGVNETSFIKKIFEKNLDRIEKDCYLGLYLTLRCNFACPYCYLDEQQTDITKEIAQKSLNDLFKRARRFKAESVRIDFWGGEPLLCPDKLEYAVLEARKLSQKFRIGLKFNLLSNGSIFNPRIARLFSRKKDLALVQIPLDGPQEIHDQRRFFKGGTGSYNRIINNLPSWMKIAQRVVIRVNIDGQNRKHIPRLLQELSRLNKNKLEVFLGNVAKRWGRGKERKEVLEGCDYKPAENKFLLLAKKLGLKVVKGEFPTYRPIFCKASGAFPDWVGPDGKTYCCTKTVGNEYYRIGDIFKGCQDDKVKLWLGYNLIQNQNCLRCKHLFFCGGICPADAMRGEKKKAFCGPGFKRYLRENLKEVKKKAEKIN